MRQRNGACQTEEVNDGDSGNELTADYIRGESSDHHGHVGQIVAQLSKLKPQNCVQVSSSDENRARSSRSSLGNKESLRLRLHSAYVSTNPGENAPGTQCTWREIRQRHFNTDVTSRPQPEPAKGGSNRYDNVVVGGGGGGGVWDSGASGTRGGGGSR